MDYRNAPQPLSLPKFVRHNNGCEIISNDGEIKILLRHRMLFNGSMEQEMYTTDYYIKEDNGWLKTNTSKTHSTIQEFMREISNTEEFTQAVSEYQNQTYNQL